MIKSFHHTKFNKTIMHVHILIKNIKSQVCKLNLRIVSDELLKFEVFINKNTIRVHVYLLGYQVHLENLGNQLHPVGKK